MVLAIDPAVALSDDPRDPHRLLVLCLVRRASFGLVFVGLVIGIVVAGVRHEQAEVFVDTKSTDAVLGGVFGTFAVMFLAVVARIATRWIALALVYPLARLHQGDLGGGTTGVRRVGVHLDRLGVARALRELRFTEGVLSAARDRVGDRVRVLTRIDRAIGVFNVVSVLACAAAVLAFGLTIEM